MKKHIVIGITSGIAAYKVLELIQLLRKDGCTISVIMTKSATRMIDINEFEKVSGNKVDTDLFGKDFDYKKVLQVREVDHIKIADSADVFIVIPATANSIAKIAHGIADDFLTTTLLAVTCPILICPSMNVHMWNNIFVQENITKLKKGGMRILDPENGMLACGYTGTGRLMDVEKVKDHIMHMVKKRVGLKGKKILVTAGGTREKIDDVRFISNKSSGKMGVALAEELYLSGADVLLLRGKKSVFPSVTISYEEFETSFDLEKLIEKNVKNFDVIFHAAAVSDYTVENTQDGKIDSSKEVVLKLKPQEKIINSIKKMNPKIFLVGFKAVWNLSEKELEKKGKESLEKSQADAVVVNDVGKKGQGFESDMNEVVVVLKNGSMKKISLTSKREVAREIIHILWEEK